MATRKQPRDNSTGRFKVKAAPTRKRKPGDSLANPITQSVQSQAWLAGNGPGWWISDHMEELRHFTSWMYVGVHKIAQQWAQATCNVYTKAADEPEYGLAKSLKYRPDVLALARHFSRLRTKSAAPDSPDEDKTLAPDHEAKRKLDEPNPYVTGRVFRYQIACQIRLTGGCYIWEVPNQFDQPEHLWVIPRGWCRPNAPTPLMPNGGWTITPVFNSFTHNIVSPSLSTFTIPYEQMIQVGYPNPLYPGEFTSPLAACSRIVDIMEQTDTATWSSFVNAVKPSLVFSIDPKSGAMPSQEMLERFYAELDAFKAGAHNHGKILAMLGLTVQQLMSGPAELDFVNGRQQNRESVLAIQGVAPVVAGLPGATSYSEAAVGAKTTIEMSVAPDTDIFSDVVTRRWRKVWPDLKAIELSPKNFDDPTIKLQKIDKVAAAFTAGVVTMNEYRAAIDMEEIDDPMADVPKAILDTLVGPVAGTEDPIMGTGPSYAGYGSEEFDTAHEPPDADGPNEKRPLLQAAAGNRAKSVFRLNGYGVLH